MSHSCRVSSVDVASTPYAREVLPIALSHGAAHRADQPSPQRLPHRAQQPAGCGPARAGERDGGPVPDRDRPGHRARAGHADDVADPADRRRLGGRGRHLHRLLLHLHCSWPGRRGTPALLRHQRGVDHGSQEVLGEGGAVRPDRAAARAGHRHAALAAGRGDVRPGVHRRRQGRLPRLLARGGAADQAGRADHGGLSRHRPPRPGTAPRSRGSPAPRARCRTAAPDRSPSPRRGWTAAGRPGRSARPAGSSSRPRSSA